MGNRWLAIFCACWVLFHIANAARLPLVGDKLALQDKGQSTALMSACGADDHGPDGHSRWPKGRLWGRKPLFLAGFAVNVSKKVNLFFFASFKNIR
jgi:hypothetical protein